MRQQIDRTARRAAQKIDQNVLLIRRILREKAIRSGLGSSFGEHWIGPVPD
jgi:hypothetical protein